MLTRRNGCGAAVALLTALTVGCDPASSYKPVDADGNKVSRWSTSIAGVQFSAYPYSTLIGSHNTFMELMITNESKEDVEVLDGELDCKGRTLKANLQPGPADLEARTVPAGSTKEVDLLVNFDRSASDALGPSITWVWRVRIGTAEHTVRVPMDR